MKKDAMYLLAFALTVILIVPIYAQTNKDLCKEKPQTVCSLDKSVKDYLRDERFNSDSPVKNKFSIIQLFKSKAFAETQNVDEERRKIREEWKELLGLDVFYPYFKAQEIEDFVQKKATVKFFNMHGRPEFNKESKGIKYIFKSKF
jgi:hypothetical protein